MQHKLRDDWFRSEISPSVDMSAAGIFQWSIDGVGVYVGRATVLRNGLRAYPKNVLAMIEGRPWHGNPEKDYRDIHYALREAYEARTLVTFTVLEICDPAVLGERKRHWLHLCREEAKRGGPEVLTPS